MPPFWSEEIDALLKSGPVATAAGINNWVLGGERALAVLKQLEEMQVAVLGGDVFRVEGDRAEPTYDNWYCEKRPFESCQSFGARSISLAAEMIEHFAKETDRSIGFGLVPDVRR